MKKTAFPLLLLLVCMTTAASAQTAPPPRPMPRVPVSRETLVEPRDPMPASRQLQGPAAIIDGEKLRIGESDLRLFGIVPPQLAASFGPQARAALDSLANGQAVSCQIRDRDRDGRLLATCRNAAGSDMALELLKRGLAVTARGSIAGTELATSYLSAEQSAQNQKIGLWSAASVAPAPPAVTSSPKQESVAMPAEIKEAPRSDKAGATEAQMQAKIAADIASQQIQSQTQARLDDQAWSDNENAGFFERYQILIACFLMLATALSIIAALWAQKRRDRSDETKAIAAALRGELMAARSVCGGRAKEITNETEDRAATWPRIRGTLYQAYVGRLGLLGAELARHIASIYGQSSDYAALYSPTGTTSDAPKRQALEMLAKRIEEILPTLAQIERTGQIPTSIVPYVRMTPRPVAAARPTKETTTVSVETPTGPETAPEEHPSPLAIPQPPTPTRTPVALWENVRGFLQNHRNAVVQETYEPHPDTQISEYAAMIEADMANYQYSSESLEPLDISPQKKSG